VRAVLPTQEGVGVTYAGPVPKAEVRQAYTEADVLLLILPGSRYVTSGKVYEYMATGKPIVSVHDPDSSANEPLRGYPHWFPVRDLSAQAVSEALVAAGRAARRLTADDVARAREHAARFTRSAQLAPLEAEVRTLVEERRATAPERAVHA
jgi:glycosyltransferase involved in cell wall biosynthesis